MGLHVVFLFCPVLGLNRLLDLITTIATISRPTVSNATPTPASTILVIIQKCIFVPEIIADNKVTELERKIESEIESKEKNICRDQELKKSTTQWSYLQLDIQIIASGTHKIHLFHNDQYGAIAGVNVAIIHCRYYISSSLMLLW